MINPWQIRRIAEDLPNFRPLHAYEAAVPVYEAYVEVRVLRKQELSPLERMVLASIQTGVNTIETLEIVLGATRSMLRAAVAAAMASDLVSMRETEGVAESRLLILTEKGAEAAALAALSVPMPATVKIVYDGMLGSLTPLLRNQYINRRDVEVRRLYVLPAAHQSPSASELSRDMLRRYLKELARIDPRRAPQGELHDVVGITGVVKLFRPVDVVAFDAEDQSEIVFRVFDGAMPLTDYGDKLGVLFQRVPEVLPFVRRSVDEDDGDGDASKHSLLDQALVQQADQAQSELAQVNQALESAPGDLDAGVGLVDAGPNAQAGELAGAPSGPRTKEEVEALRAQKAELEKLVASVRTVGVWEHPQLLEKALRDSRKRVMIVSPWLSDVVIDADFLKRAEKALRRGVDILVCWGMPPRRNPSPDDERQERRSEKSEAQLRSLNRVQYKGKMKVVRLGNTHEKILLVDRKFALVTSFNFLSFRGDKTKGFRQETGIYHEIPAKIDELAEEIMRRVAALESGDDREEGLGPRRDHGVQERA